MARGYDEFFFLLLLLTVFLLFCFCLIDLPPATCHRLPHAISTVCTLTVSYLSYPILFNALISCVINPLVTSLPLPLPGSNQRLLQLINPVERAPIQLITHFSIPQTIFPFPLPAAISAYYQPPTDPLTSYVCLR